jgi:hypothetical protein
MVNYKQMEAGIPVAIFTRGLKRALNESGGIVVISRLIFVTLLLLSLNLLNINETRAQDLGLVRFKPFVYGTITRVEGNRIEVLAGMVTLDLTNTRIISNFGETLTVSDLPVGAYITTSNVKIPGDFSQPFEPAQLVATLPGEGTISGPIQEIDQSTRLIKVLNQTIRVADPAINLAGFSLGEIITVGVKAGNGELLAKFAREDSGFSTIRASFSSADNQTLRLLNDLIVLDISQADIAGNLSCQEVNPAELKSPVYTELFFRNPVELNQPLKPSAVSFHIQAEGIVNGVAVQQIDRAARTLRILNQDVLISEFAELRTKNNRRAKLTDIKPGQNLLLVLDLFEGRLVTRQITLMPKKGAFFFALDTCPQI